MFFIFFQHSVLCIVKMTATVDYLFFFWVSENFSRESDVINVWLIGLEVVREENNLII